MWFFFFFKQKTAYEMRISDWSSDVCASDLTTLVGPDIETALVEREGVGQAAHGGAPLRMKQALGGLVMGNAAIGERLQNRPVPPPGDPRDEVAPQSPARRTSFAPRPQLGVTHTTRRHRFQNAAGVDGNS